MKHTKGEWIFENIFGRLIVTAGKKGFVIAEVTNKGVIELMDNEEQAIANAKLIAVAPELLKALQYAIKFIKFCPKLKEEDRPRGLDRWEQLVYDVTEEY